MRVDAEKSKYLYNWITVQEAGAQLGGVSDEHVLELGRCKQLRVIDLRVPGAKRGVYRVEPESVTAFMERRELGAEAA